MPSRSWLASRAARAVELAKAAGVSVADRAQDPAAEVEMEVTPMTMMAPPRIEGLGVTGSRYFGTATQDSDLDTYAQDSPENRAALLAQGFRPVPIRHVGGPNMSAVFRRYTPGRPHTDVGLFKDAQRKAWEQKVLSVPPIKAIVKRAPKPWRTFLWNIVQNI
jgi:hypothetical protein